MARETPPSPPPAVVARPSTSPSQPPAKPPGLTLEDLGGLLTKILVAVAIPLGTAYGVYSVLQFRVGLLEDKVKDYQVRIERLQERQAGQDTKISNLEIKVGILDHNK